VEKRLCEELAILPVEINDEKSRIVDLTRKIVTSEYPCKSIMLLLSQHTTSRRRGLPFVPCVVHSLEKCQ
jgi:hypothetical protein